MASVTITGKILFIGNKEKITEKLTKRAFAVETNEEYPQSLSLEAVNKAADFLDKFKEGQEVIVEADLRGRAYVKNGETKYFNSISAWKITENGVQYAGTANDDSDSEPLPF